MLIERPALVEIAPVVNGERRSATVPASMVLADYLRDVLGLKGCKVACDAAVCGACTVLVDRQPVAACATLAFEVDGADVRTIEGLGTDGSDPVQALFASGDAFQCGFCTPGMILSVKALLAAHPDPSDATIREWLGGNLCRCTGYGMILDAVRRAATALRMEGAG